MDDLQKRLAEKFGLEEEYLFPETQTQNVITTPKNSEASQVTNDRYTISDSFNFGNSRIEFTFRNSGKDSYSRVTVYENGAIVFDGTADEYSEKYRKNLREETERFEEEMDRFSSELDRLFKVHNENMDRIFPKTITSSISSGWEAGRDRTKSEAYKNRKKRSYKSVTFYRLADYLLSILRVAIIIAIGYFLGVKIIDFFKI